jgi:hypothetical protein
MDDADHQDTKADSARVVALLDERLDLLEVGKR